jgi:ABC-type phosphate transport system auxiliary subunit
VTHDDFVAKAQRLGGIVLLCIAIWALTGMGYFWPKWVMFGLAFPIVANARRVYGSGRSDREPE